MSTRNMDNISSFNLNCIEIVPYNEDGQLKFKLIIRNDSNQNVNTCTVESSGNVKDNDGRPPKYRKSEDKEYLRGRMRAYYEKNKEAHKEKMKEYAKTYFQDETNKQRNLERSRLRKQKLKELREQQQAMRLEAEKNETLQSDSSNDTTNSTI